MNSNRRGFFAAIAGATVALVGAVKSSAANANTQSRGFMTPWGHSIEYDGHFIRWNDPISGSWDAGVQNEAGSVPTPYPLSSGAPRVKGSIIEFDCVHGGTLEIMYVGQPLIFSFRYSDFELRATKDA